MTQIQLMQHVAESLNLPLKDLVRWRRNGTITLRAIPEGWILRLNGEPASSRINEALKKP